ncbi:MULTISPECIES: 2OG-Fe(II) oxygenase family protein [Pseudofrankia]|uniref:2OG-Fe(II) oxygenase family protein n=1 Tax=Pseudofrankia TaxID=2994363 RepID=UPI000234C1C1|nr:MULTISPECIES: 2OG-Fe(II) oxygenase family protein [Pseudofrankia]OHV30403.1 MFS transporter [Pseudofrankia sp. EUN1h]
MADLRTFQLPDFVDGTKSDIQLAGELIDAWRAGGILQVAAEPEQDQRTKAAIESSGRFFGMPTEFKRDCISGLTYSGYIALGEERTAGEADYSEIFTVCPDVRLDDPRVRAQWPCHGPVPWPDDEYEHDMLAFMAELGSIGERLLRLTALGLGIDVKGLTDLTAGGWHHMRVLRFPARSEHASRGIGAHTDYGLLVIAAQDDVGGLYIRPPVDGEQRSRNWLPGESMAGRYENEEPWTFVPPVPSVFTVFPGDMLQLITDGFLLSTPHKVRLNTRERFALAYFHEPNFQARVRPLSGGGDGDYIHYGRHFTSMFMRSYPERVTTRRILEEDRLSRLIP